MTEFMAKRRKLALVLLSREKGVTSKELAEHLKIGQKSANKLLVDMCNDDEAGWAGLVRWTVYATTTARAEKAYDLRLPSNAVPSRGAAKKAAKKAPAKKAPAKKAPAKKAPAKKAPAKKAPAKKTTDTQNGTSAAA